MCVLHQWVMSEFSEINTVSDLIASNSKPEMSKRELIQSIYRLDANEALEICHTIIILLAKWHGDMSDHFVVKDQSEQVGCWEYDRAQLDMCIQILSNIEL